MYLPLAALVAAGVVGLFGWLGRRGLLVALAITAFFGGLTIRRNADYRSALAIWTDTMAKRPDNARAQAGMGGALLDAGRPGEAIPYYERARQLNPEFPDFCLGNALLRVGRAAEAIPIYERAVRLNPDRADVCSDLGGALAQLSSIIDCADGMLARARGQSSAYGASLDLLLDRIDEFFLLAGAVLGYYAASGRTGMLILGLLGAAGFFLLTTLFYLIKNYRHDAAQGEAAENRSWLMALLCIFGVLNRVDIGIFVLAGTMAMSILAVIVIFFRMRPAGGDAPPSN